MGAHWHGEKEAVFVGVQSESGALCDSRRRDAGGAGEPQTSGPSDAVDGVAFGGGAAWLDNVFIERLWRPLKWECVYLNAFDSARDRQAGIGAWMDYYNRERTHSSLGDLTPSEAYETWRFSVRKPSDEVLRQHQSTSIRLHLKFAAEFFKEWGPPLSNGVCP